MPSSRRTSKNVTEQPMLAILADARNRCSESRSILSLHPSPSLRCRKARPSRPVTGGVPGTSSGSSACERCAQSFTPPQRPGPSPRYRGRSHRQRAYEAHHLAGSRRPCRRALALWSPAPGHRRPTAGRPGACQCHPTARSSTGHPRCAVTPRGGPPAWPPGARLSAQR
jgi:hypothetical protein